MLSADPATGKIRISVTFKPRSNKNNVSWGTVNNYHAGTQVLFKSMTVSLHPMTGYAAVRKQQTSQSYDYTKKFPNNYSLEGAVYRFYTDQSCTSAATDAEGGKAELVTRKDGSTQVVELEPGTYYVKETTASRGYKKDKTVHKITVTSDNTSGDPAVVTSLEQPVYAPLRLELVKESDEYGYRRLIGTKYELSYYDTDPDHPVISDSTIMGAWTFAAEEIVTSDGLKGAGIDFAKSKVLSGTPFTEDGERILPLGVITIREVEAPKGLAVDPTVYAGTIRQNGEAVSVTLNGQKSLVVKAGGSMIHEEESKSVLLRVNKVDAESGEAAAEGADRKYSTGSLAGAVYDVYMEDTELSEDVKVGRIVTDVKGEGQLDTDTRTGDRLRPGRYYIKEVKASPGYVLDHFSEKDRRNIYEDGRHVVLARSDLDSSIIVYDYQAVSHEMHHETYISKTDITTGEELPGARLIVINSDGDTVEEWESGSEPHLIKALPDGEYTLREITAPYGYDIAEDVKFNVTQDKVTNEVVMKNSPVTIHTSAADKTTGTHAGMADSEEIITDTVELTGLYPGRTYKVTGTLMDRDTEEPVTDKVSGESVTAELEFTADAEEMTVNLEFTVDASEYISGRSTVVFEKLIRLSQVHDTKDAPIELQKHENINDEDQTIRYGGIVCTEALDAESRTHNIIGGPDTVIVDTVSFHNLSTKDTYTLLGQLYDKTDGVLIDSLGTTVFTPEDNDGRAEVEFRLDTTDLKGHSLVVFEYLSSGDTVIDKHDDADNEDQTVSIEDVPKTYKDVSGGPKTGDREMAALYAMTTLLAAALMAIIVSRRGFRG